MSVWWALAVLDRAPEVLPPCALEGARLDVLALPGELALVAAELPALPGADVETLRRHDAAVRALAAEASAVLPIRFGAHASAPEHLVSRLRGREDALREGLARVHDAAQVTLRARSGPPLEVDVEPDPASLGPGARFLRQRARAREARPPGWRTLAAGLLAHVRAERFEAGDARSETWRGYHLVPRASASAYAAESASLAARVPAWGLIFGAPAPPYAFAAEVLS